MQITFTSIRTKCFIYLVTVDKVQDIVQWFQWYKFSRVTNSWGTVIPADSLAANVCWLPVMVRGLTVKLYLPPYHCKMSNTVYFPTWSKYPFGNDIGETKLFSWDSIITKFTSTLPRGCVCPIMQITHTCWCMLVSFILI